MKCVLVKDGQGPVENLYIGEEATPEPKAGEVQIKVSAAQIPIQRASIDAFVTDPGQFSHAIPKAGLADGKLMLCLQNFGLNRMDLSQREGKYPLPPQASKTILGVEFSGTVTKLGEGASKYKIGDEVFGLAFGVSSYLPSVAPAKHRRRPLTSQPGRVRRIHLQPRDHAHRKAQGAVVCAGRCAAGKLDDRCALLLPMALTPHTTTRN